VPTTLLSTRPDFEPRAGVRRHPDGRDFHQRLHAARREAGAQRRLAALQRQEALEAGVLCAESWRVALERAARMAA
jgi:hypothetical protein